MTVCRAVALVVSNERSPGAFQLVAALYIIASEELVARPRRKLYCGGKLCRTFTANPKDVYYITVYVVYSFYVGRPLIEKHTAATEERFQVNFVRGKLRYYPVRYPPLPARIF